MFASLDIFGLRGFATRQTLNLAIPSGVEGSGLTVLVGANNAGKSTAMEALRALNQVNPLSFTQGRRNKAAGDKIELKITEENGGFIQLESQSPGTSETKRNVEGNVITELFVLPARRVFPPYFGKSSANRFNYMQQLGFPVIRTSNLDHFTARLFEMQNGRDQFDALMRRVVDPPPVWTIDQEDSGQYYLKLNRDGIIHSSEGLGEGLVSLIYIIDALYDSQPGQLIAIDEPELSLHPALQRKLAGLLAEYAKDRQILIARHSPYFINFASLAAGAKIARVHLEDGGSKISTISAATATRIDGLLRDRNNPHVLGLNAQETFFLDDRVILVEGQEDVVHFERVEAGIAVHLQGELFGWGVGGADKMDLIAQILQELGFKSVVGVLDGNKEDVAAAMRAKFPEFHFFALPANDVRTKTAQKEKPAVVGLLDEQNHEVRPEFLVQTREAFEAANAYLNR